MLNGEEKPVPRRLRPAAPVTDDAAVVPRPRPAGDAAAPSDDRSITTTGPGAATTDATKADPTDAGAAQTPVAPATASAPATVPTQRRGRLALPRIARRIPRPAEAGRAVAAWSRRPSGRLALPGLLLFALVVTAGAAGAVVVPAAAGDPRPTRAPAPATGLAPDTAAPLPAATGDAALPTGAPTPTGGATGVPGPPAGGRPADALAGWATQVARRIDVPAVALQAYGYTELVLARTTPGCRLTWTTLAAIGKVESQHGHANGATLGADGVAAPRIVGPPLNGRGGTRLIEDTDRGELDGDLIYDRAVGPMQFIPTTWREVGADADLDGRQDPNNIHDAALAAGNYLCRNGRDLTVAQDWWNAILSYNDVRPYAQAVFDAANDYGRRSRT